MDDGDRGTNIVVEIVKVDYSSSHGRASTDDDGRLGRRGPDLGQQLLDQQEVGQVVDAKLRLDPVDGLGKGGHHDARHGDEVVDLGDIIEVPRSSSYIFEVEEVDLEEADVDGGVLGLDLGDNGLDAGLGSGSEDEGGWVGGADLDGEFTRDGVASDTSDEDLGQHLMLVLHGTWKKGQKTGVEDVLVLPARDSPYLLRMNSEERMTCELAAVDMAVCFVGV